MRLRFFALLGAVVAFLVVGGTAGADSGTSQRHHHTDDVWPAASDHRGRRRETIDAVAAMSVAANDITLDLYDPSGALKAHGDAATSPEEVLYQSDNLATGVWHVQVCPFSGGVIAAPYDYNGTFSTSNAPVQQVTPPGSGTGAPGGTPTPKYVAGNLVFSPATVVDPQRTEGEPLNFVDPKDERLLGERPVRDDDPDVVDPPLDRQRARVPRRQPRRPQARCAPGGGDTDIAVDDQGYHYFVDLEALVNLGTSVSNDDGNSWRKNPVAVQNAAVDRQWYTVDNGTTASRPRTTRSSSRSTRARSGRTSSRAPARPARPTRLAGSSGRTPPRGAKAARSGRDLRADPLRQGEAESLLRLQRGHAHPRDGRARGARPAHRDRVPQRDRAGLARRGRPGAPLPRARHRLGGERLHRLDRHDRQQRLLLVLDRSGHLLDDAGQGQHRAVEHGRVPRAQAGSPGTLALGWYATDTPGQPDSFPNWADDPQGATTVKWYGYAGLITNAASLAPTVAQQRFTEKPMHYGQICNQGIGCTVSGGDRTMADYFAVNFDRDGALRFVYNDTTSQHTARTCTRSGNSRARPSTARRSRRPCRRAR